MNIPLVSICIPLYNGEKYLEQCLNSAINQTYKNIEILLVDDTSGDNTWNIANKYATIDNRIRLYRNDKNLGLTGNFNKCLELANGEWIKLLLQDDYLTDDCIEIMMAGLSERDKIAVCKRTFLLDGDADEVKRNYYNHEVVTFEKLGISSKQPVYISPMEIETMATRNICMNFIGEPTSIMLHKSVLAEAGYFNTDLAQICDLEYFVRIASNFGIKYIPAPLTYFRIHRESTTQTNITNKNYTLSHIDPIIMVHQFLYNKSYQLFRENLSILGKIKLNLYFHVRVYEAYKSAADNDSLGKFEVASEKYTMIGRYKNGSFFTLILLKLVKSRRKARN